VPQPTPNARLRFEIVYEDESVVVANKAPGMVTEPGASHREDSLLNALVAKFGGRLLRLGERRDYGLLHRLDRQTSGCVACALTPEAYDAIRAEFEARTVDKRYLAIVRGRMKIGRERVERNLLEKRVAAAEGTRLVSVIDKAGKPAATSIEVLAASPTHSLVACVPETGRLHQIRVHLAYLGFPIAGEPIYTKGAALLASTKAPEETLGLHAWTLGFSHAGKRVDATAPPSRKFIELTRACGLVHASLAS
jgi:23S rRNA pseudouridine1911/1915/1917 synthase